MTEPSPRPRCRSSRQFTSWLVEATASLVPTTRQSGKGLFIGCHPETGKLSISDRTIDRQMGSRLRPPTRSSKSTPLSMHWYCK
jgi:hypothetical protein